MNCPHCFDTGWVYEHDEDHEDYAVAMPCPFCDLNGSNQQVDDILSRESRK